jgi:hypothetical protein
MVLISSGHKYVEADKNWQTTEKKRLLTGTCKKMKERKWQEGKKRVSFTYIYVSEMDTLCLHLIFIIFDSPSFIFCKKTT